jgi:acylphosphatase
MDEILRIVVSGQVQGVGFRAFTERTARRLGIAGWVRNLPTGDVEVLARVSPGAKQAFLAQLRQGPSFSRVTGIRATPEPSAADCPQHGFTIRH